MLRMTAFAAALLWASAAWADVTAVYSSPDGYRLTVEADARGSARFGPDGGSNYSLFTPEGDYIVWHDGDRLRVASYADLIAVTEGHVAALLGEPVPAADSGASGLLRPAGREEVAGRSGTLYAIGPAATTDDSVVLSDDPALVPVGRAFARALLLTPTFASLIAGGPAGLQAELAALLERGAPLRFAGNRLERTEAAPIDPARFRLPAAPMSRDEVAELLALDDDPGH